MPTPVFHGIVDQGKLKLNRIDLYQKHLGSLEGKKVKLTIKRFYKDRSLNQNNYYWAVIIQMIADEVGAYTKEEREAIHNALRHMFLIGDDGFTARSTTDLNTIETEKYYSDCRMWASEFLNMYIPLPNEVAL